MKLQKPSDFPCAERRTLERFITLLSIGHDAHIDCMLLDVGERRMMIPSVIL
jgi:hypothetical protein